MPSFTVGDVRYRTNTIIVRPKTENIPHLEHSDADKGQAYIVSFMQAQELTIISSRPSESRSTLDLEYHFNTQTGDRYAYLPLNLSAS